MEEQVAEMEQEVIITNNKLLFHFHGHNNDLLVLKQWKGALNRTMPTILGLLKNNNLALRARSLFSGIILNIIINKTMLSIITETIRRQLESSIQHDQNETVDQV